jgi:hypothetical protein
MADDKNTTKVRGFWLGIITSANAYIGFGAGLVVGYVLGRIFG